MAANITDFLSWSTTATSNKPSSDGSDTADIVSDLQKIQAEVRKYVGTVATSIASASTVNLAAATGNYVKITGTTGPITSFGTVSAGVRFLLEFEDAVTISHNATSMILCRGGVGIVTEAKDTCEVISLGSGNWLMLWYQRNDGTPLEADPDVKSLGASGYYTLSGGLVINWLKLTTPSNGATGNWPRAFVNACVAISATRTDGAITGTSTDIGCTGTTSGYTFSCQTDGLSDVWIIALGY